MRGRGVVAACLAAALLAACQAPNTHNQFTEFNRVSGQPRILLLPPDIELSEMTAGGLLEPKAEWTATAQQHIGPVLHSEHESRGNRLVDFTDPENPQDRDTYNQVIKLHGVVGRSILIHQYLPPLQLPTKNGKFDWSLGPSVEALRRQHEADYALFIYIRDSYTGAGRVALMMVAAAFGVGLQGGTQTGFASLVDLKTGDIVWFNRLARPTGDLRTPEAARETIQTLLAGLPK